MMAAAMMFASTLNTMGAFAEASHDSSADSETYGEFTVTDIDVAVDAVMDGQLNIQPYGNNAEDIENSILDITHKIPDRKIYVEVEWDEMKFTYDFGTITNYDWNLDTLEYDEIRTYNTADGKEGWSNDSAVITFTNFSNRDVYSGLSFERNPDVKVYDDVEIGFDKEEFLLLSAVGREPPPTPRRSP